MYPASVWCCSWAAYTMDGSLKWMNTRERSCSSLHVAQLILQMQISWCNVMCVCICKRSYFRPRVAVTFSPRCIQQNTDGTIFAMFLKFIFAQTIDAIERRSSVCLFSVLIVHYVILGPVFSARSFCLGIVLNWKTDFIEQFSQFHGLVNFPLVHAILNYNL